MFKTIITAAITVGISVAAQAQTTGPAPQERPTWVKVDGKTCIQQSTPAGPVVTCG